MNEREREREKEKKNSITTVIMEVITEQTKIMSHRRGNKDGKRLEGGANRGNGGSMDETEER